MFDLFWSITVQCGGPYLLNDIDVIENVQRSFLRRLTDFSDLSYVERLQLADLEPLELRRIKADIYFLFKIIHKCVRFDFNGFFLVNPNSRTRCHWLKLRKKKRLKDNALYCFSNRVVDYWNSLPMPRSVFQEQNFFKFKSLVQLQSGNLKKFMRRRIL